MTTESVKLDRAIVRLLRRFSKKTGIPISRLANRMLAAALKNPNRVAVILALDDPEKENNDEARNARHKAPHSGNEVRPATTANQKE